MKSHVVPLCSTQDMNRPLSMHSSAYTTCMLVTSHSVAGLTMYRSACVQGTLILLNNGHKAQE